MPRKSRIDAPGALHHIIVRGIERRPILRNDDDRNHFLERLGRLLKEIQIPCLAWTLIPQTGTTTLKVLLLFACLYRVEPFRLLALGWPMKVETKSEGAK